MISPNKNIDDLSAAQLSIIVIEVKNMITIKSHGDKVKCVMAVKDRENAACDLILILECASAYGFSPDQLELLLKTALERGKADINKVLGNTYMLN